MLTANKLRSKRRLLRLLIVGGVVAIGLALASAAFAGWTSINLGSSSIDATWGTADFTDATNNGPINDRDEIQMAWVRYDGTNIYFRVQTWAGQILSNTTSNRLVGALDCNQDGDFTDAIVNGPDGDRLIVFDPRDNSVVMYDGAFTGAFVVSGDYADPPYTSATNSIEWGVPLYLLYPGCRGSQTPIKVTWVVGVGNGTVIDQAGVTIALSNPMDYGDTGQTLPAPPATCGSPYTGLQCNGARHGIAPMTPGVPLRFGNEPVDADPGNLQSANADADDTNGTTPNDEQGIYPDATNSWSDGGGVLNFTVVGAAQARLGCWIDFNQNGMWTDAGEAVLSNVIVNSTTTSRSITIPGGLTWPNSFPARCRIWQNPGAGTPTPVPAPNGPIEFGEVEDRVWSFDATGAYISVPAAPSYVTNLAIVTSGTQDVTLTWNNPAPNDSARVLSHASDPYFTASTGGFLFDQLDTVAPWEYLHTGIRGDPPSTAYYIVYGRAGTTEVTTPSNRVGLFEFGLTAGQP